MICLYSKSKGGDFMSFDSLSEKTDQYRKDRDILDEEFELFESENEKLQDIDSESLDEDIQGSIDTIHLSFSEQRDILTKQEEVLDDTRSDLSEEIGTELEKVSKGKSKFDALAGKKYASGFEVASEKCDEYIRQLESMLDLLDADIPSLRRDSSFSGADSSCASGDA